MIKKTPRKASWIAFVVAVVASTAPVIGGPPTRDAIVAALNQAALTEPSAENELLAPTGFTYFSAANCIPISGAAWEDYPDTRGFEYLADTARWANFDDDDVETLVCPIPYQGGNTTVTVRVWVHDSSPTADVIVSAYRGSVYGNQDFPNAHKKDQSSATGRRMLQVTITPDGNTYRLYMTIEVPHVALAPPYVSAVFGYAVQ